ncbi:TauD/TfdA family dioxygenase [Amycolatopsis sp. DG1A-15b]|uniref:TauD/TfdA family dioxygenase n=1 Tax=Amycolatopsis sp. DG1A-15b TaxID=3052846 RepID=UPI00255C1601|nr:TauD/TfdA family dioxygenase [Amycolatopsis sp. DG1A-15b]WIX92563.1 TauD/TfdA family dioxygenase [Amycolatopsis sp. DG1A-15b]
MNVADLSLTPAASGATLPLVISPRETGGKLAGLVGLGDFLNEKIHLHGAVLLRGFGPHETAEFESFVRELDGEPLDYTERSSPRSVVDGKVYTSTSYPADMEIFMHNEQSYNLNFPQRLFFMCVTPPPAGGETLLADSRRVLARLDPEVVRRFEKDGYLLVRNYRPGLGLPWSEVFGTDDRDEVTAYCHSRDISVEWTADGLRTTQRRDVIATHPVTGESSWFNHATFFHVTTLDPEMADVLVEGYGADGVPTNTCYGDGSPIDDTTVAHLRDAYRQETTGERWEAGDVLIVDNVLASHGRAAYTPPRWIVLAMAKAGQWGPVAG